MINKKLILISKIIADDTPAMIGSISRKKTYPKANTTTANITMAEPSTTAPEANIKASSPDNIEDSFSDLFFRKNGIKPETSLYKKIFRPTLIIGGISLPFILPRLGLGIAFNFIWMASSLSKGLISSLIAKKLGATNKINLDSAIVSVSCSTSSIPLLTMVDEALFLHAFPVMDQSTFKFARFSAQKLVLGSYKTLYEYLRGKSNLKIFFAVTRSIYAIPLAVFLSYLIPENVLPGVLLSKLCSDLFAVGIETGFALNKVRKSKQAAKESIT